MEQIIFMVLEYAIHALIAFALGVAIKWINDKRLREIANDAVLFAQQVGSHRNWSNEEKFNQAKTHLIERLTLTPFLSEEKIVALVESALKRAKKEFHELW